MTYVPPPFPALLTPNHSDPSARPLQRALKAAQYMSTSVPEADNYGPMTQAAVVRFHVAHGKGGSGAIDANGWYDLFVEAYGDNAEPPMDMTRVPYSGVTINIRTRILLSRIGVFTLSQGSYHPGFSASGGTHDGGGVIDVAVGGRDGTWRFNTVLALRKVGFAAWLRSPAEGFPYHIHAVAIGDREMSPSAHAQVLSYFNGRNGLANNAADSFTGGRPYPVWALKYNH